MRVGVYTRLSQYRPDEVVHFAGATERQAEDVEAFVQRQGWEIVHRWTDRGKSGWTGRDRADFNAMIEAIEKREIDLLAVWKFDRLTRNLKDYARFYEVASANDVALIGVADGVDTRQLAGQLHADISFAVARNESATISARVRATTGRRAAAGRPNGGKRPFGYTRDRLHIEPVEAELVREAYARFIAGEGAIAISKDFHRRGVVNSGGGAFTPTALKRMIRNPRYAGMVVHQGEVLEGVEAAWPAVVPRETWEAAQSVMTLRGEKHRQQAPRKYLLAGLVQCHCGARMISRPLRNKRRYICPPKSDPAISYERCGGTGIFAEPVEEYVAGVVLAALVTERARAAANAGGEQRVTMEKLSLLKQRLVDNEAGFFAGRLDISQQGFEAGRRELAAEIEKLETSLDRYGRDELLSTVPRDDAELDGWWDALPFDRKVAFTRAVISAVVIQPGRPGAYTVEVDSRVNVRLL